MAYSYTIDNAPGEDHMEGQMSGLKEIEAAIRAEYVVVGWQQRGVFDGSPDTWQFCDERVAKILRNRADYEVREVFALVAQTPKP